MKKLSIVLKQLRESRNLTIKTLAELSGLSNGAIGDIETGKSNGSKKSISKIADALNLSAEERGILDSAFLGREVVGITDPRVRELNKKELSQYEKTMTEAGLFFNDDTISDEDKEKMFRAMTDLFFEAKKINREKRKSKNKE